MSNILLPDKQRVRFREFWYVLCMKKPVLIVIDMLADFLDQWEPGRKGRLVQSINELVDIARSCSCPVIWVR
jgi:hypothetical protein